MSKQTLVNDIERFIQDYGNNEITLKTAVTSVIMAIKKRVPEEKNFFAEVVMWRDDADMAKTIRGECRGFNDCREAMLRELEG